MTSFSKYRVYGAINLNNDGLELNYALMFCFFLWESLIEVDAVMPLLCLTDVTCGRGA